MQTPDRPVEFTLAIASLDSEPRDAQGSVKIHRLIQPEKVHRPSLERFGAEKTGLSDPDSWESGELVSELPFSSKEGKATLSATLPEGIYRASLETRDPDGNPVRARLTLSVVDPAGKRLPIRVPHLMVARSWKLEPGESLDALWGTGYDRGRAYVEFVREGKVLKSFWTAPNSTLSRIQYPVTEELRGGFTLRVTRVQENRAYLEKRDIAVPWSNKQLSLRWEHFTSKLLPGARETWTAVLSAPDGKLSQTEMVATLYDASLDQFAPWRWNGMLPFFRAQRDWPNAQFQNRAASLDRIGGFFTNRVPGSWTSHTRFPYEIKGHPGEGVLAGSPKIMAARTLRDMAAADFSLQAAPAAEGSMSESPEPAPTTDPAPVTPRKNLEETAFFLPHLTSDPEGRIRMEFTMPEALTTWRFLGFAHDAQCRAGLLEARAVTARELMIQPNPPRFLREADTVEFTIKVVNRSNSEQRGSASLHFSDAADGQSRDTALGNHAPAQPFAIPAGESRSLSWRISVPDGTGFLTYKAVASTETLSDGEEGWLPVLSRRILVTESLPLPIRGPATREFTFQKLLDSADSKTIQHQKLVLQMVSNPAWYAVMALPYLMEYPHDCNEQIFNRLYANALASHIAATDPKIRSVFDQWRNTPALDSPLEKNPDLKSLLLEETPWLGEAKSESQSRRNVGILFEKDRLEAENQRAFRQLRQAQYSDGTWPWFAGGRGSDFITLYITCGFARLRHLGAPVDMSLALKALGRLDEWIEGEYDNLRRRNEHWRAHVPTATEALYLYTRSFFLEDKPIPAASREAVDFYLDQARKHWLQTDNRMTQGQLALALKRFGDKETPAAVMASLKEQSVSSEEMGMFWKDQSPNWWWHRAPIETQALLIEAFDEVTADRQAVEDCRVWLLKQKQTQNWKSTKATADAVYALLLRGEDILSRTDLVEVALGGMDLTPPDAKQPGVEAGTGSYEKRFTAGEIRPEMGRVTVQKKEEGVAWGGLHWQYLESIEKVTPHEGTPLKLKKQVYRRVNTAKGQVLEPISGPVAPGDELIVRVELRVDRAMEYVQIKDQRGSGTEPVNVLSKHKIQDGLRYFESTRDTASHFFIESLPEGTYVFEYPLRVQLRGEYQTGIAEVQCMYAPEFNSHSGRVSLQVR